MMITLLNTAHFYIDLYVSPAFWTLGLMFDRTECGCVWDMEIHIPFLILQVGYIRDGEWDDEAVWEPAPIEECDSCGFHLGEDGECEICGWQKGKK